MQIISHAHLIKSSINTDILSVQQLALSIAKKLAKRQNSHGTVLRSELIKELRNKIPQLSGPGATAAIQQILEEGKLILIQDSGLIKFLLRGTICDRYIERQQWLQIARCECDEIRTSEILAEGNEEQEEAAILRSRDKNRNKRKKSEERG